MSTGSWTDYTISYTDNASWASCSAITTITPWNEDMISGLTKPPKKENTVNVYLLILIDAMEAEIIRQKYALGRSEADATASLGLTKDEHKKVTQGDYALVISEIGEYTAPKITRTKKVD